MSSGKIAIVKNGFDILRIIEMDNENIKKLLSNNKELIKLIDYKRKEKLSRIGGISENKKIFDFEYMHLDFSKDMISSFERMQRIYVLDDKYLLSLEEVKKKIKELYKLFKKIGM